MRATVVTARALKVVVFLCLLVGSYFYASGDTPHLDVRPTRTDAVNAARLRAGPGFTCWAEDNATMPDGYEVMCAHTSAPLTTRPR